MAHPILERDATDPCAATASVPTLSTMYVDDDDDTLDALRAAVMRAAPPRAQILRDRDLAHMPTNLAAWATSSRWPTDVRHGRRRSAANETWMMGTVVSAVIAMLLVVSALLWRIERPTGVPREHAPASLVAPASGSDTPDAISGASRR